MIYINYKFKILFYRIIILNITILYMYNSKYGKNSMKKSSSEKANNNTALGSNSLKNNIDGYQNSAIGSSCLHLLTFQTPNLEIIKYYLQTYFLILISNIDL